MTHPNNITYQLEDLFDEDLDVIVEFILTLERLDLSTEEEFWIIAREIDYRQEKTVGEL